MPQLFYQDAVPLKRVKQEIKALVMPQLFYQDAVTDLTANKNGILHLFLTSHMAWPLLEIWTYFQFYFAADVSQKDAHDCCDKYKV